MMEFGLGCFFLGATVMALGSWILDRVRPTENQQLRTYERRQKLAVMQAEMRMNLDALKAIRDMQRGRRP